MSVFFLDVTHAKYMTYKMGTEKSLFFNKPLNVYRKRSYFLWLFFIFHIHMFHRISNANISHYFSHFKKPHNVILKDIKNIDKLFCYTHHSEYVCMFFIIIHVFEYLLSNFNLPKIINYHKTKNFWLTELQIITQNSTAIYGNIIVNFCA